MVRIKRKNITKIALLVALSSITVFQMFSYPLDASGEKLKTIEKIQEYQKKRESAANLEDKKDYGLDLEDFKNKTDENTIYDLSKLEEMRKKADINDKVHSVNIELYEKELKDVLKSSDIPDYGGEDRVTLLNRKNKIYVKPQEAHEKVNGEKRLKLYNSKNAYIQLEYNLAKSVIALNERKFSQRELEYVQKTEEIEKLKYELGKSTVLKYLEAQNKTSDAKNKLSQASDNVSKEFIELKRKVGVEPYAPLMTSYNLAIKKELPSFILQRVNSIVANQNNVKKAKILMDIKHDLFKYTAQFYKDFDKEYIVAEADYKIALMNYNDAYNTTMIDFTSKREDAIAKYEKYKIAKSSYELKKTDLKNRKLEYSLGRISKLDLFKVEIELEKSWIDYLKSIVEYNKLYDELILMSTL